MADAGHDPQRRALVIGSAAAATAFLVARLPAVSGLGWPQALAPPAPVRGGRRKLTQAVGLGEGFVANGKGVRDAVHYVTSRGEIRGSNRLAPARLVPLPAESDLRALILRLPRKLAPAAIERAALARVAERPVAEALVMAGVAIDLEHGFGERRSYRLYDLAALLALARDYHPDRAAIGPALASLIGLVEAAAGGNAGLATRVAAWRDPASAWHVRRRQPLARGAVRWRITDFDGATRLDFAIAPAV